MLSFKNHLSFTLSFYASFSILLFQLMKSQPSNKKWRKKKRLNMAAKWQKFARPRSNHCD